MSAAVLLAVALAVSPTRAPCADPAATAALLLQDARTSQAQFERDLRMIEVQAEYELLRGVASGADTEARARLAGERLTTLCALKLAPSPNAPGNRALLDSLYQRPEFANARDRHRDAFALLFQRIMSWLELVFSTRGGRTFVQSYRVLVLALAFFVMLAVALRLWRGRGARSERRTAGRSSTAGVTLEDPSVHLRKARAALAEDPREGIREALLALLSSLERRKLARPDRVKTNRELAAELPARGAPKELSEQVARLVRWYDATFYSLDAVPPADAERFLSEVAALTQEPAP